MILLPSFSGKTIFILGLGKTGLSACDSFLASGATLMGWDDGEAARQAAPPSLTLTPPDAIKPCDAVFISPGIPENHPVLQKLRSIPHVNDVDLFYQAYPNARYIGITGTNGKSTTTALMAHIFKHANIPYQMGGNIGVPILSLNPPKAGERVVLELSSYQLDLMQQTRIHTAALLNITPDHLERHGTMQRYAAAKQTIFSQQNTEDHAIISVDDAFCQTIYQDLLAGGRQRILPLSVQHRLDFGVFCEDFILYDALTSGIQAVGDLRECPRLAGRHNAQNAAAAYAMARAEGIEATDIMAALKTFPGLAHRQEWVADDKNVIYINDSKATNMDAAARALSSYQNIFWILGGKPKDDDLSPLSSYYPNISKAYCIGEAGPSFHQQLTKSGLSSHWMDTLEAATIAAHHDAQQAGGGVVLLSPACASFDQFQNYEHRGDVFRNTVRKLTQASAC